MMTRMQTVTLVALRIAVGWFLLYQGIIAIITPSWSILPMIKNAHTFSPFYASIGNSSTAALAGYVITGLFILVGALLILGLFVRIAALLGIGLMLFFYFPLLAFPKIGNSGYVVNEHLIIALTLLLLYFMRAGEYFSLGKIIGSRN